MKKFLIIGLTIFPILFCFGQKYNPIKFDTIHENTSVKKLFLKNVIAKDDITYQDNKKLYTAIEAFEKFKQTRNATQFQLKIENRNKQKVIGNCYAIEMYVESDTIFTYDNLRFNRFQIYSNLKDQTVAFKLFNDSQDQVQLNKFLETCSIKNKDSSETNTENKNEYFFDLEDRVIILKKLNQRVSSPMEISVESEPVTEDNHETTKNNEEQFVNIELFVIFKNLTFDLKTYFEEKIYAR